MEKNKKTISISIDRVLDENMEISKVNKSKLINHLLKEYLSDNKTDKKTFNKK